MTKWLHASLIAAALMLGAAATYAQGDELLVTNVQAQQQPGTHLVDITYDLESVGDIAVTISVSLSTDSGVTYPFACQSLTGDVGDGVLPGTGKHIVWDAGADFPDLSSTTCRLQVTADDGVNLDDFVVIPAGTFTMGSPTSEPGRSTDEAQHQVTLTRTICVSKYEVTQAEWQAVMGWNVSSFPGVNRPVENVNWYDAVSYCNQKSTGEGLTPAYAIANATYNGHHINSATVTWNQAANGYRLPTEAEWEYACRAGSTTAFANGPITQGLYQCLPIDPNLDQMGWYCGNASMTTHDVGGKMENAWGLFDMHGNACEWCWDWYGAYGGNITDPVGPGAGSNRVIRGGNWIYEPWMCRSAFRISSLPNLVYFFVGFRPVRSVS
jgi:formylglycine-generating enzyme required for sulfatase activity